MMASRSQLKKKLRDAQRLLKRDNLAADVKVETERKVKALQAQLEQTSSINLEKKYSKRYHKIKFFEKQKVTRKARAVKKQLEELQDGEDDAERERLEKQLEELQDDFFYLHFYPRDVKFVSLFPNEPIKDQKVLEKQQFIRRKIAEMRVAGLLADSKKLVRWRDLSSRDQEPEEDDEDDDDDDKDSDEEKAGSSGDEEGSKDKEAEEGDDEFFAAASSNVGDLSKRAQYVVEDHLFANKVAEEFDRSHGKIPKADNAGRIPPKGKFQRGGGGAGGFQNNRGRGGHRGRGGASHRGAERGRGRGGSRGKH